VTEQFMVAVVGAGPAGLFGARELANKGVRVVVFNRDVKPGGLAEYGIFPTKHIMKEGLRKQFRQILDNPNIMYFGNINVGTNGDINLDALHALGFDAILVTVGAQGTKWLGLPGESLQGVYHAKDVVYFYNRLPPYTYKTFLFGKRCAVVGAGNVMVDISHYLIRHEKVDEVIAIVRRGPVEVKFDKKEMEHIIANLDIEALDSEIARIAPIMQAVNQNPETARSIILEALPKADPKISETHFRFEFLASPIQMIGDNKNRLHQIELEDNILLLKDGETKAKGTGKRRKLNVDTVIFAIGDKVDENFGLPVEWNEFVKAKEPKFPIEGISYETEFDGLFVGGWSRQASHGLVGYARKDGINAAKAVLDYLHTKRPSKIDREGMLTKIKNLGKHIITREAVRRLESAEAAEARKRGLVEFKYSTNEEMLAAIASIEETA
jgi:ferredoxin--NADP+ reductase